MKPQATGIFGKLPAHGDFLHRNLPSKVVNEWDSWLQTFVGSTQERLGDAWLDVYLTSPIWRYCLSPGVVDDHYWGGIVLPSVDRVGRYFPFSIMRRLPETTVPCDFMTIQTEWFAQLEQAALRALDGQTQVEALVQEVNAVNLTGTPLYVRQARPNLDAGVVVDMDFDKPVPQATLSHFLDAFVASTFSSYSVWSTSGSDRVDPCVFITHGMPPVAGAAAMLDGLWEDWEWSVPVRPLTSAAGSESGEFGE